MRFMYIVTSPQPIRRTRRRQLMEAMHKLADREIKAGRMLDSGGLMPVSDGRAGAHRGRQAQRYRRSVRRSHGSSAAKRSSSCATRKRRADGKGVHAAPQRHMPGWVGTCELRPEARSLRLARRAVDGRNAAEADTMSSAWRFESRGQSPSCRDVRVVPLAEDLRRWRCWRRSSIGPDRPFGKAGRVADGDGQATRDGSSGRRRMLALNTMVARDLKTDQLAMPDLHAALDDDIGDELLRLIFTACHPHAVARLAWRWRCG